MEIPQQGEGTQTDPGRPDPFRDLRPHQINDDNDIEIQIECVIEEDTMEELEDFMRLTRQGLFTQALNLFNETLKESLDKFPVLVEYVECLYDQGQTSQASQFLHQQRNAAFSKEEKHLLELLDALLRVKNEQEEALATARRCTGEHLALRVQFTDTEVLMTIKRAIKNTRRY
jgi:thioredoxin-like negative regulator of GroEL